jgi:hypothetical protein
VQQSINECGNSTSDDVSKSEDKYIQSESRHTNLEDLLFGDHVAQKFSFECGLLEYMLGASHLGLRLSWACVGRLGRVKGRLWCWS